MRAESIVFAVAGACFGLFVGWLLGAQAGGSAMPDTAPVAQDQAAGAQAGSGGAAEPVRGAQPVDEGKLGELEAAAEASPQDAAVRAEIGNVYFDAERFAEAARWYEASLAIDPRNADASTDLGVSYYYTNQPDRALEQFEHSLRIDPEHTKTLLNLGIVRAFAKQDLERAAEAWERVVALAPESPEGQTARTALEALQSAHPDLNRQPAPESP